jgi:hypothetical protein
MGRLFINKLVAPSLVSVVTIRDIAVKIKLLEATQPAIPLTKNPSCHAAEYTDIIIPTIFTHTSFSVKVVGIILSSFS